MLGRFFNLLILTLGILIPFSLAQAKDCSNREVSINLFQIHHAFDQFGQCLHWKTKSEPQYIENDIPSNRFHLFQDQQSWNDFDYLRFCYDENNQQKLGALLKDLEEQDLMSFTYDNLYYQFGILNSLTYNISRKLSRNFDIWQNGIFYYGTFVENQCSDQNNEPRYNSEARQQYENQMQAYHGLMQIILKHFEAVERYSFLPSEIENQN